MVQGTLCFNRSLSRSDSFQFLREKNRFPLKTKRSEGPIQQIPDEN